MELNAQWLPFSTHSLPHHHQPSLGESGVGGHGLHAVVVPPECHPLAIASLIFCPHCPSCFPVAIPILLFFLLGQPVERGFHCDDESLRYPYKDSTVSTGVLYAVGTLLPATAVSWASGDSLSGHSPPPSSVLTSFPTLLIPSPPSSHHHHHKHHTCTLSQLYVLLHVL